MFHAILDGHSRKQKCENRCPGKVNLSYRGHAPNVKSSVYDLVFIFAVV